MILDPTDNAEELLLDIDGEESKNDDSRPHSHHAPLPSFKSLHSVNVDKNNRKIKFDIEAADSPTSPRDSISKR